MMYTKTFSILLTLSTTSPLLCFAATHVPLTIANAVQNLGPVTDATSNKQGIFHDGGGGGTQNGYHVQIFADSMTTSNGFNFVHNSIAYYGYRNSSNPLDEYTLGLQGNPGNRTFKQSLIGPQGNETTLGSNFAIWPLSGLTPLLDGKSLLGIFPCLNEGTSTDLYSTMVQITVDSPSTIGANNFPVTKRLGSGRLFYPNEVQYGSFSMLAGVDGWLYLFGADLSGVKLARTPDTSSSIADRNQYQYYNSTSGGWQKQPLVKDNANGNVRNWSSEFFGKKLGIFSGDVWYDPYHQTTMMVFMDSGVDGQFWFSYATNNSLTGPWSTPVSLWTSPVPAACKGTSTAWNYAGHAHPGWDTTGKTLLLSYSSCTQYVSMAKITWA